MTSMMKTPPRFETCLFGPSGTPIPIKAYEETSVSTATPNTVSDSEGEREEDELEQGKNLNDVKDCESGEVGAGGGLGLEDTEEEKETERYYTSAMSSSGHGSPSMQKSKVNTNDGEGGDDDDDDKNDNDNDNNNEDNGNAKVSTPPQTPAKSTPPPRPAKVISKSNSHKKLNRNTSSSSSSSLSSQNKTNHHKAKFQSSSSASVSVSSLSSGHTINLQELRRLSSQGVPDDCTHRPLAWRVLLGYLPLDTSKWQQVLDRDRLLYRTLVRELFVFGEDYPFEEEGHKLIGRGLNYDGKKVDHRSSKRRSSSVTSKNGNGSSSGTSSPVRKQQGEKKILPIHSPPRNVEGVEVERKSSLPGSPHIINAFNNQVQHREQVQRDNGDFDDDGDYHHDELKNNGNLEFSENTLNDEEEIPYNVREQWRKSGRDPDCLMAGMGKTKSGRFVNALLVTNNETASTKTNDEEINLKLSRSLEGDYDPKWRHFLENASLLDEIRKDVVRTHPDLKFFLEPNDNIGSRRYSAIERVLFVWSKLNKGVRYVQGMNEIVGTLYFVLANDENEEWASEAEADTYFLFNTLMVEMRDIFVPDLDEADTGIQGRMANMIALLSLHDPEVRCHLDDCGIDPGFYSIRWLTTLLSREFLLPDTIRLWDSMFASTHKDNFMRYVCVCMVMVIREDLLKGDFGTCLRLLQSYPPTNVDQLLESSRALWIYESQVTLACHKGGISLSQALSTIAPPPAVLMAYGLHGGLTMDQVGRMRQEMEQLGERKLRSNMRFRKSKSPTATSTSTTAKTIMGFLGLSGMGPNGS
eukprot:CAMPEP_0203668518 /NCGR_PEP_ID=MMETSP0090-20130426/5128_1 /ASSEMBLY_ACC=CAM_ASM_001088 /TAXON_ID=426623 /ORGANISM="Chaetoceros affinis, Strain CCMP159" /LENGTH=807 /DNA_ID=CAMNT_0050532979 /DNA_START=376 /DNA_END=2799 /DNA_ORIENTATION=-